MVKSGKKQDLIERITGQLDKMRYTHLADKWDKARAVIYQVKNTGGQVSTFCSYAYFFRDDIFGVLSCFHQIYFAF